jgi:L-lactate utilization protein LutC
MTAKEKMILQIMEECEKEGEPVTREEAKEMAEMEIKANGIKRYEKSDKPRKKTTRERKVDETKKKILLGCKCFIEGLGGVVVSIKTETEVKFTFEGEEYTLKLTKHRPPKK